MTNLAIVVIYKHPLDYPKNYVARRQWAGAGGVTVEPEPLVVADTLDEARAAVPAGMVCMARSPGDEPQIVECWL